MMCTHIVFIGRRVVRRFSVVFILVLPMIGPAAVWAEGLEEPLPSLPQLQEFLEQFGRHLDAQDDELERGLHDFSRLWEEEQQRFLRDTEEIRAQGERALAEFMERSRLFLEESEVAAEEQLRAMRESVDALGTQNLQVTIYVVAAGGAWNTPRPLPDHLDSLRGDMSEWGDGAPPVLLDVVKCRTRLNEEIAITSNLPDGSTGIPQGYQLQIRQIVSGRAGAVRLEGLRFQANMTIDGVPRVVLIEAQADVQPGQPTLLGTGSLCGLRQAILLVGVFSPVH